MSTPGILESGGVALACERLGSDDASTVVLLHGGPGLCHRILLPLGRRLAASRRVLLPDLPGHGASRIVGADGSRVGLAETREVIGSWLRGLNPVPSLVVGHSLGARLLIELTAQGLVLPIALVAPPLARAEGRRPRLPPRMSLRRLREELLALAASDAPDECSAEFRAAVHAARLAAPASHTRLLSDLLRGGAATPGRARGKAMVVAGGRDELCPRDAARALADRLDAPLTILPEHGHYPFATAAGVDLLATALLEAPS